MDREKLEELKSHVTKTGVLEAGVTTCFVELIDALLEDDKPKTEPDLVIPEERRRKRIEELTRKLSRYRWSPEGVKAIKESIIHWRDIVSRLRLADEWGLGIILTSEIAAGWDTVPWGETKRIATFSSLDCALCRLFYRKCDGCPLAKIGEGCMKNPSAYHRCCEAKGNKDIIEAAENMLRVLVGLLE